MCLLYYWVSQMVHETMCRMGCGFAWCGSKKTYVCNYASGDIKYKYPFKSGSACQDCPSKCVGKLCGKFLLYTSYTLY